ncbi:hypothetical protein J5J86_18955 [Aquabacter sp. L1I39]|uniref:bestrophin-like domain n=1 Tax=Aquabacter sp. L1I39 TaxID=2820278 RepID=UPI001ADD2FAB|nr:hypothetical protein [Aquabacter sp. L1I39]QTL02828.1 hypothetical protein J5J86_18955 [Aquabacter sp. L1I39]
MNALTLALIAFLAMAGAAACGCVLARRMPPDYLGGESIKSLRAAMALVATMTGLILGLMVNSSRFQYSDAEKDVQMYATTLMRMDIELTNFGGPACALRGNLRAFIEQLLLQTWPMPGTANATTPLPELARKLEQLTPQGPALPARPTPSGTVQETAGDTAKGGEKGSASTLLLNLTRELGHLPPENDIRRTLISLGHQLMEYRWRISDFTSNRAPTAFIGAVICWLALLYGILGVFAPRTPLVLFGFLAAIACIASAIYLVLEMDDPFSGQLRVPRAPISDVLTFMASQPCPSEAPPAATFSAPSGP